MEIFCSLYCRLQVCYNSCAGMQWICWQSGRKLQNETKRKRKEKMPTIEMMWHEMFGCPDNLKTIYGDGGHWDSRSNTFISRHFNESHSFHQPTVDSDSQYSTPSQPWRLHTLYSNVNLNTYNKQWKTDSLFTTPSSMRHSSSCHICMYCYSNSSSYHICMYRYSISTVHQSNIKQLPLNSSTYHICMYHCSISTIIKH